MYQHDPEVILNVLPRIVICADNAGPGEGCRPAGHAPPPPSLASEVSAGTAPGPPQAGRKLTDLLEAPGVPAGRVLGQAD
jgi:hypothetical protein